MKLKRVLIVNALKYLKKSEIRKEIDSSCNASHDALVFTCVEGVVSVHSKSHVVLH